MDVLPKHDVMVAGAADLSGMADTVMFGRTEASCRLGSSCFPLCASAGLYWSMLGFVRGQGSKGLWSEAGESTVSTEPDIIRSEHVQQESFTGH